MQNGHTYYRISNSRYRASDDTGYVADVRYEGTIKPLPSEPKPVIVPAPPPIPQQIRTRPVGIPISGLPISGLPRARPVQKRNEQSTQSEFPKEEKRKRKQQQQAKQQQQEKQQQLQQQQQAKQIGEP